MPIYDKVLSARYGTDTEVRSSINPAIWVRLVEWHTPAPINIAQHPNIYLDAQGAREYAAYLLALADRVEGNAE